MKEISYRGNCICFGRYALQALESTWITSRQIEAGFANCRVNEMQVREAFTKSSRFFPGVMSANCQLTECKHLCCNVIGSSIAGRLLLIYGRSCVIELRRIVRTDPAAAVFNLSFKTFSQVCRE
ncbi:hypothetical protein G4B88_013592 [Cannabis sativa]|uniref:Uncharacterized protein n=1 Tax=Cannabis sativa TaxID=3483 RepID=A0A7J6HT76_CANSA|nr:hypothetical protein G4B88_013592 [Cannabis sativa]